MDNNELSTNSASLGTDCISRQAAINALDEIRHALWEIDIPSPTVPEYVEHHEQVQSVWKLLDKKQKELYDLSSAQAEQSEMIKDIRKWINSGNRGNVDYFIVDKIEEIINKYER